MVCTKFFYRHVSNTQDIGHIVVTNFTGFNQGTKRLTAVTGHLAEQVRRIIAETLFLILMFIMCASLSVNNCFVGAIITFL